MSAATVTVVGEEVESAGSERDEARAGAASAVLAGPPPPAATAKAKPRVGTELV